MRQGSGNGLRQAHVVANIASTLRPLGVIDRRAASRLVRAPDRRRSTGPALSKRKPQASATASTEISTPGISTPSFATARAGRFLGKNSA